MPRIFDNIEQSLLPALCETLNLSTRADFCVGYFNLRGWKAIDSHIERLTGGPGSCCRLLVGMQTLPHEDLRVGLSLLHDDGGIDQQAALALKKRLAEEFREQLTLGAPNNQDEAGLRRLSRQIRGGKVVIKLFLRHPLHAKLYLLFRVDPNSPIVGFLGSSNLTMAGLAGQGELNVDVLDYDACLKLERWFDERWKDRWCLDISGELAQVIDSSWAREQQPPPYHIYLKMAYHLSREARAGLSEFRIPSDFGDRLFDFQKAAVKIAAHHLNKRGGVIIGDVVGLGKTLMATALARIFQDDQLTETLIICPKNLVSMWRDYVERYRLIAKVLPISKALSELPDCRRYRVVVIDESHNLRNREGKRFKAIREYIEKNESRCVLLSATPYNKSYLDLSAQLRLFLPEDQDIGIRPERKLKEMGETEFIRRHQCPVRSLAAFEKSDHADDWRDLMRHYLVRRTRSFIQENYAETDVESGRQYLRFEDGTRSYFPRRVPKTIKFSVNASRRDDQYARLFSREFVDAINSLSLPRYGLGNYYAPVPHDPPTTAEGKVLGGLSRAGKRLMGFCRINLFKRLESGGPAFIQSLERHVLRNFVVLHAIESRLPIPIGTQDSALLDSRYGDEDAEASLPGIYDDEAEAEFRLEVDEARGVDEHALRLKATELYAEYSGRHRDRFHWLRPSLFVKELGTDLLSDNRTLMGLLAECGPWEPERDAKLNALLRLITEAHPREKVLVFTQFADTVRYVAECLRSRGVNSVEGVTGQSPDPTAIAWRFSPVSNERRARIRPEDELRVLIATDVLSEGQNLQDCSTIVNYDLPWAIIRLAQRAGRVDRIGQKAQDIACYSFLPAEGIEQIIGLRSRVRQRLRENADVVGTDELFFEDDADDRAVLDIYNEKAGILDGEADSEVDLASFAYQIWKNATDRDPSLLKTIAELPNVVYSTRAHRPSPAQPSGVLLFMRTAEGSDALAWIDPEGRSVTQSQLAILRAAACEPETLALERDQRHHELVQAGVAHLVEEERALGGQLGRPSGARFRVYELLKDYLASVGDRRDLFVNEGFVRAVQRVMDDIYRYPLRQVSIDILNRQLRAGVGGRELADIVTSLRDDDRLCRVQHDDRRAEPQIICSLGLSGRPGEGG